jgi:phage tail-like protein
MPRAGDRHDPLGAFRFEVKFDDLDPAGFSNCSGLQLETEVMEYAEGGLNSMTHRFVTRTRQQNLTLRRGIVGREVWDWYFALTQGDIRARNGTIRVFDAEGRSTAAAWEVSRALPIKWNGPELSAGQSSVAVETVEFCHQGLQRVT